MKSSLTGLNYPQLSNRLQRVIAKKDFKIYPGFFLETLPDFNAKVALIHIDSDLYSSAQEILDSLFSRNLISDGCLIMFDDYDLNQANPRSGERLAWSEAVLKYQIQYSDRSSYGLFGHKYLIHGYVSPSSMESK